MITREQWERKSTQEQWVYLDMLQRLYENSEEEPPIDPTDTGAIRAISEITGYEEDDRYGKGW